MNAAGRAEQERIDPVTFGEWHYESQSSGLRHEVTCKMTCADIIAIAQRREGVLDEVDHSFWGKLVWDAEPASRAPEPRPRPRCAR